MTSQAFEVFLARVYTEQEFRERFLAQPEKMAREAGLSEEECRALEQIDRVGLEMAARTFEYKRSRQKVGRTGFTRWLERALRTISARRN